MILFTLEYMAIPVSSCLQFSMFYASFVRKTCMALVNEIIDYVDLKRKQYSKTIQQVVFYQFPFKRQYPFANNWLVNLFYLLHSAHKCRVGIGSSSIFVDSILLKFQNIVQVNSVGNFARVVQGFIFCFWSSRGLSRPIYVRGQ